MVVWWRNLALRCVGILGLAALAGGAQPIARSTTSMVTVALTSPQDGRARNAGDQVRWELRVFVDGGSEGLALIAADLSQGSGNPELFDLPAADGAPAGMEGFDRPSGFANSGQSFTGSGYGGIQVGERGKKNLEQIGGAQNVFGVQGPCFGPTMSVCLGQTVQVEAGIGQSGAGQLVAQGSFTLPEAPGTYVFELSSVLAYTIDQIATPPQPTPISRAQVVAPLSSFSVRVRAPLGDLRPEPVELQAKASSASPRSVAFEEILVPAEGARITQTHTRFRWPAIPGVTGATVLEIVEDDGSLDPFVGGFPVHSQLVSSAEPRAVVKQGLSFGKPYAWRVYEQGALPGPDVRRFETAPLPAEVPSIGVTLGTCAVEPGLTMFGVRGVMTNQKGIVMAVDEAGNVVHFLESPNDRINDVRQMPTGQLLIGKLPETPSGSKGRVVVVTTRGGQTVWASPDLVNDEGGDLYPAHHEAALGPDGDFLFLVRDSRELTVNGSTDRWKGDRIVLLDRQTSELIWSWSTFDHYSLLDDGIDWNTGLPYGPVDWTHANGAVLHSDGDIYFSARNISRVTRIDYPSGNIVYNLGMDMPSGETDFGDGLFSNQHAPQMLSSGNLLLFDNGNLNLPLPLESSAKEIAFDDPRFARTGAWQGGWTSVGSVRPRSFSIEQTTWPS